jgi:hypothetical protein
MDAKNKTTGEAWLAQHALGRVVLHLACLAHDGKWSWHWAGACREFHSFARPHLIPSTRKGTT